MTFAEYWKEYGHLGCNPEDVAELAWNAALSAKLAPGASEREKLYQTVREALEAADYHMGPCSKESGDITGAIAALSALEAGEREAELEALCGCGHPKKAHMAASGADCGCSVMLPFEPNNKKCCPCEAFATPPAPPAAECACRKALEVLLHHSGGMPFTEVYSNDLQYENALAIYMQCKAALASPCCEKPRIAPSAAECAICGGSGCPTCCEGLRAELARHSEWGLSVIGKLADIELERNQLRAELAAQRKATEEAQAEAAARVKQNETQIRINFAAIREWEKARDALTAELDKAVELLRAVQWIDRGIGVFLEAYDAKRGTKS